MSWNPMGPLGGLLAGQQFKENQLGAGVTLGNPQAQEDYVAQLARALADSGAAKDLMDRANALKESGWIDNSGLAGVAERMFSGWASKKMSEKARNQQADAEARRMTAQEGVDDRKAEKDAARSEAASNRERTRRQVIARKMDLNNREAVEFIETGKVPQGVRGVPMMTNQGLVNVNPETGEYTQARPAVQQLPPNTHIDPRMSPEDQAIALADATNNPTDPHGETVDYGRIQRPGQAQPLMPYKDPAEAQRQASADSRAERSLSLQEQSAGDARAARQSADDDKQKAAQARQAASVSAAQDLIDSIDRVTGSKGYGDLGTLWGDVKTHIPGVRNDAKDAQASLDNIGGQVALSTMATLKALSAQGATGFGALSKPELDLLKNSIAALQAGNLSHDALDANLKVVRSKMGRITSWQGDGQPSAPAAAPQPGPVLKYNPKTGGFE